jgi:hypothetical protein
MISFPSSVVCLTGAGHARVCLTGAGPACVFYGYAIGWLVRDNLIISTSRDPLTLWVYIEGHSGVIIQIIEVQHENILQPVPFERYGWITEYIWISGS